MAELTDARGYVLCHMSSGGKYVWHKSHADHFSNYQEQPYSKMERALYWNGTEWEPAHNLHVWTAGAMHGMADEQAFRMVGEELARWLVRKDGEETIG